MADDIDDITSRPSTSERLNRIFTMGGPAEKGGSDSVEGSDFAEEETDSVGADSRSEGDFQYEIESNSSGFLLDTDEEEALEEAYKVILSEGVVGPAADQNLPMEGTEQLHPMTDALKRPERGITVDQT